jgi:hypothetical protein
MKKSPGNSPDDEKFGIPPLQNRDITLNKINRDIENRHIVMFRYTFLISTK